MRTRKVLSVVVAIVLGAGCSADGGNNDAVRPVDTTTSAESTGLDRSTTTVPSTVVAPSSAATLLPSSTTVVSTSTIDVPTTGYRNDPAAEAEHGDELIAIAREIREIFLDAQISGEFDQAEIEMLAGPAVVESFRRAIDLTVEAGQSIHRPQNSVTASTFQVLFVDQVLAAVEECHVNDLLVVEVDTGDVVNDELGVLLRQWELERSRTSGWRATSSRTVAEASGVDTCDELR